MVDQDDSTRITVTGYDFDTQTFVCESDETAPALPEPEQEELRPSLAGLALQRPRRVK